jgi:hypothetical protein
MHLAASCCCIRTAGQVRLGAATAQRIAGLHDVKPCCICIAGDAFAGDAWHPYADMSEVQRAVYACKLHALLTSCSVYATAALC